jgi:hypothetical protein
MSYSAVFHSSSVPADDVNRDGYINIIVANIIDVLLNTDNGTFAGKVMYSTGSFNVNRDGELDIIVETKRGKLSFF